MKHVVSVITILVLALLFAGCSQSCFYQAGKTADQGEYDLQQCIHEAETYGYAGTKGAVQPTTLTSLCMGARGYQYLDADRVPQNAERVKVAASFGEYWLIDGGTAASASFAGLSEPAPQASAADAPRAECIGYKAQRDEAGKFVFIPVYQSEQTKDTSSKKLADSGE